jgi:hypothetical protein
MSVSAKVYESSIPYCWNLVKEVFRYESLVINRLYNKQLYKFSILSNINLAVSIYILFHSFLRTHRCLKHYVTGGACRHAGLLIKDSSITSLKTPFVNISPCRLKKKEDIYASRHSNSVANYNYITSVIRTLMFTASV